MDRFLNLHGDTLRAVSIEISSIKEFKKRLEEKNIEIFSQEENDLRI